MSEITRTENAQRIFNAGTDAEARALRGVSLSVEKGEMLAIMGASGSGKTTLLNILGFLDTLTAGKYILEGQDASHFSEGKKAALRNRAVGFVLQDFGLVGNKSVRENISYPLIFNSKVKDSEISGKVKAALERVGLNNKYYTKCSRLSGGQKQRVAIARAIVNEPKIILADEPTGALDQKTSSEIINVFRELNGQGATVIIVTHDINVAKSCGRIIEISDGKIVDQLTM